MYRSSDVVAKRSSDALASVARTKKILIPNSGEKSEIVGGKTMGPRVQIGGSRLQPSKYPPRTPPPRGGGGGLEIKTGPKLFGQWPVDCIFWCKLLCFPPFFERNPKKIYHFSCFMPLSSYPFPKYFIRQLVIHAYDLDTTETTMLECCFFFTTLDVCCLFLIVI